MDCVVFGAKVTSMMEAAAVAWACRVELGLEMIQ